MSNFSVILVIMTFIASGAIFVLIAALLLTQGSETVRSFDI